MEMGLKSEYMLVGALALFPEWHLCTRHQGNQGKIKHNLPFSVGYRCVCARVCVSAPSSPHLHARHTLLRVFVSHTHTSVGGEKAVLWI